MTRPFHRRAVTACAVVAAAFFAPKVHAASLSTLISFDGANGSSPYSKVTFDPSGNLFGTTQYGGASDLGTAFKISAAGSFSTIFTFTGTSNGEAPYGGLLRGPSGDFYGTTKYGGAFDKGTAYKLSPTGAFSNLFSFNTPVGYGPSGDLILDGNGNLYGSTAAGGGAGKYGTAFRITALGSHQMLGALDYTANGSQPVGGVALDAAGTVYGTAAYGGANGYGTLFKISGGIVSTAVQFNGTNGALPLGQLVPDGAGSFIGTTSGAGVSLKGSVFRFTPGVGVTPLFNFNGTNGQSPQAAVIIDAAGNIFGTTVGGGANGKGTVFKLATNGTLTTLISFNGTNGSGPNGSLAIDASGNLYGTTNIGGANNKGTVFKITASGFLTSIKPGDANLDNFVNFDDLLVLAKHYSGGPGLLRSDGDFTGDGYVNFDDLLILARNYQSAAAASVPQAVQADWALAQSIVPEPSVFASTLAVVIAASRRRGRVLSSRVARAPR